MASPPELEYMPPWLGDVSLGAPLKLKVCVSSDFKTYTRRNQFTLKSPQSSWKIRRADMNLLSECKSHAQLQVEFIALPPPECMPIPCMHFHTIEMSVSYLGIDILSLKSDYHSYDWIKGEVKLPSGEIDTNRVAHAVFRVPREGEGSEERAEQKVTVYGRRRHDDFAPDKEQEQAQGLKPFLTAPIDYRPMKFCARIDYESVVKIACSEAYVSYKQSKSRIYP